MKTRTLGPQNNPLEVSALGLGCMPMAGIGKGMYGEADRKESFATIDRAIELGVTFFDTAEVYGPYKNEELLGEAIRGRRERLEALRKELRRMLRECSRDTVSDCRVLEVLRDHSACLADHETGA